MPRSQSVAMDPPDNNGISSIPFHTLRMTTRRSSASEITNDVAAAAAAASTSSAGGRPPERSQSERSSLLKKGFNYSKAWRERKKMKRQQAQLKAKEGSSVDEEIVINRDLTRRTRNSFRQTKNGSVRYLHAKNVTAYLSARVEAEKPVVTDVDDHSSAIVKALSKKHMLDICLQGNDNISVHASSFIFGCYSPVLEAVFFKQEKSTLYDQESKKLSVDFCNSNVLKAAVYHCFSGELPADFDISSANEDIARNLAQLGRFAHMFQMKALGEVSYKAARKLINRRAVLACAVFDELSCVDGIAAFECIKHYALDTIREMPMDTLLCGGVQWMKAESLNCIMQDQDMDVDEFFMFKILNAWEQGANREENRLAKARVMAKHIELKFIATELIQSQIKHSGYFDESTIIEAIRLIEDTLADRDPHEMERVIVEGAGLNHVNGIYLRVEEEFGMMGEEDILFVKEAADGMSDIGLYLYGQKWNIAMCTDYSNCFYSCQDNPAKLSTELVPRNGWTTSYGGVEPPPMCTYLPSTRAVRTSSDILLAPNLEEMIDPTIAEKRRSGFFDKILGDTVEKRTMTLEDMMNLPEDRQRMPDESKNDLSDRSSPFD
ncbi:hypothetical protein HJC23_001680 [Cyclotella cryptica]|uniref:BTB domain-containing protein n=1 Tax=Cyclotella cryptica TaxID=29204 RepID=A0ABD3QK58_9STRA|eukprot:CCRYP_004715-RA/>CCRYP_004715-RA protein AED:0.00 eAED:0.00 QI:181/-1/1/1/-1/1/1/1461/605